MNYLRKLKIMSRKHRPELNQQFENFIVESLAKKRLLKISFYDKKFYLLTWKGILQKKSTISFPLN